LCGYALASFLLNDILAEKIASYRIPADPGLPLPAIPPDFALVIPPKPAPHVVNKVGTLQLDAVGPAVGSIVGRQFRLNIHTRNLDPTAS
jgi:hypothetical protein